MAEKSTDQKTHDQRHTGAAEEMRAQADQHAERAGKQQTEREKAEKAEKDRQEKDDKDPQALLARITGLIANLRETSPSGAETIHDKLKVELQRLGDVVGPAKAHSHG
jgi:C-terminal processing protease CtpA/Prc